MGSKTKAKGTSGIGNRVVGARITIHTVTVCEIGAINVLWNNKKYVEIHKGNTGDWIGTMTRDEFVAGLNAVLNQMAEEDLK